MMLILEIATGIVLAVFFLKHWRTLLMLAGTILLFIGITIFATWIKPHLPPSDLIIQNLISFAPMGAILARIVFVAIVVAILNTIGERFFER